ncbi:MAG: GNAT family N-acetyltransferase [Bauldia sp.]
MTDAEPPVIRPATVADAETIAAVHVVAWQETYAGLLPEAFIAAQSIVKRAQMWRAVLDVEGTAAFLAEVDGAAIGFAACGVQRTSELAEAGYRGEIQSIYLLERAKRRGLGRRLMARCAQFLAERGLTGASAWVLRENVAARRFYEQLGGIALDTPAPESHGPGVIEIAYGWADLARLTAVKD